MSPFFLLKKFNKVRTLLEHMSKKFLRWTVGFAKGSLVIWLAIASLVKHWKPGGATNNEKAQDD